MLGLTFEARRTSLLYPPTTYYDSLFFLATNMDVPPVLSFPVVHVEDVGK